MKVRNSLAGVLALGMAILASDAAMGADKNKKAAKAGPPDEKAVMEAMAKAGTPGEAHKKLEPMVGTFDTKAKMWMDPSKPAEESSGKTESKWVLGNRFVQENYEGTFMGQPFSGMGYWGYDNITKKYTGTWMDSMGTAMMNSTGKVDASGKVMTYTAMMNDPMTGKLCKITEKVTVADNDHHTMEMWGPDPSGKNYKMMEITYIRKK
jgi:hypothetical protein